VSYPHASLLQGAPRSSLLLEAKHLPFSAPHVERKQQVSSTGLFRFAIREQAAASASS
jgi:hypothetical protein